MTRHLLLSALLFASSACLHTRSDDRPRVGENVRELSLPGDDGKTYSLRETVATHDAVVLVFYRGHW